MPFDPLQDEEQQEPTLTRRERKRLRRQGINNDQTSTKSGGLRIKNIIAKTANQQRIFNEYFSGNHLLIHGLPGTGKTFLSLFLALQEALQSNTYNRVVIVRSVVPTRDIGFLPGSAVDKIKEYEAPYSTICNELFGRGDAYQLLKTKKLIEFIPTSFIRGITLDHAIVIVDEMNNCTFHELDSVITRLGNNTKVIFCGDYRQSDLKYRDEKQGLVDFMDILSDMDLFTYIEMGIEDIVRSGLVKSYIISKVKKNLV